MINKSLFKIIDPLSTKYKIQKFNEETGELYLKYNDGKEEWFTLETVNSLPPDINTIMEGYLISKYKNSSGYEFEVSHQTEDDYIIFIFSDNLGNTYSYYVNDEESGSSGTNKPSFKLDKDGNLKEYINHNGAVSEKYTYDEFGNVLTYESNSEDKCIHVEYVRDFKTKTTREITYTHNTKDGSCDETVRIYDDNGNELSYEDKSFKTITEYPDGKNAIMRLYDKKKDKLLWTKVYTM